MKFEESKNVIKVKEMVREMLNDLEYKKETLYKKIEDLKTKISKTKLDYEKTSKKISSDLENARNENIYLTELRNAVLQRIKEDEDYYKRVEDENNELNLQIENNLNTISQIKEIKNEKVEKYEDLKRKIEVISKIRDEKEKKIIGYVDKYKKYLGISIYIVRDNVVKFMFDKICSNESFQCYVVLDLRDVYCFTEMHPNICDIDKYNLMLKDKNDFYEILKHIRNDFYKEYNK